MDPLFFVKKKVGAALSRKRSLQTGGFTGIANCASTPVKLICGYVVPQHYREFDQKLSRSSSLSYCFGFLLRQPLVKAFQLRVRARSDLSSQAKLITEQR
jgi:hypothetical protein